jgi:hypothetical protein
VRNALIAAVVAAIVAAASSTAATIVVTSKNIKNGTIKTIDISASAKRALKGARGARGPRGFAGARGSQGVQGPPGPQGLQGIQRLVPVSATKAVAPPNVDTVVATCPSGMVTVSGGFTLSPNAGTSGMPTVLNSASVTTGWSVTIDASESDGANVTSTAYCSPNITG